MTKSTNFVLITDRLNKNTIIILNLNKNNCSNLSFRVLFTLPLWQLKER